MVAAGAVLLLWLVWLLVPTPSGPQRAAAPDRQAAAEPEAQAPVPEPEAVAPDQQQAVEPRVAMQGPSAPPQPSTEPSVEPQPSTEPEPSTEAAVEPEPAAEPVAVPQQGDGSFAVAPGGTDPVGGGTLVSYSVEVEGGLPLPATEVAAVVDSVLADPRSWTGDGDWSLRRTDAEPQVRILVASPETTDELCAPLNTAGRLSCRNGGDVVLNALRWTEGAESWGDDLTGYRQYLVNHELGHFLGNGHVDCPADGDPAPVMLQQTLGLQGCVPNAWPFP